MTQNIVGLKCNLDVLQTGDLLLFGDSQFWFGRIVSYYTKSKYSHIGIILRDPVYIDPKLKGLYLLESGAEKFPDSENNIKKFGVQITSIPELLTESNNQIGFLVYRKLNTSMTTEQLDEKLKEIHEQIHGKPYDVDLMDFIDASSDVITIETKPIINKPTYWSKYNPLSWFVPNHCKTNTYFCSALTGRVYTYLGFLPVDTRWSECTPEFFSSEENPSFKLDDGSYLGPDTLLYQNPSIKQ